MKIADNAEEIIIMATFGRPHGVDGYNNLNIHTQELDSLFNFSNFFIQSPSMNWEKADIEDIKLLGKKVIIKLQSSTSPENAKTYTNYKLGILKTDLPALSKDEHYHCDLIGLNVINSSGKILGKITHIWSNGAHDVFEVKGDITRILPYIMSVVLEVDLEKNTMLVDWQHDY